VLERHTLQSRQDSWSPYANPIKAAFSTGSILKTSFKALLLCHMYASLQLLPQWQNAEYFHSATTVEHITVAGDTYQS